MKNKTVAIVQSNYIPWKGYFDLISYVDEFVIYDNVQYTKRDWRNRNQIISKNGKIWLTIPVITKDKYKQQVNETKIDGDKWKKNHWKSIEQNYKKSKYFEEVESFLKPLYFEKNYIFLSELNFEFIRAICNYLSIDTNIINSNKFKISGEKTSKLVCICKQTKATNYVSGPLAANYIDEQIFKKNEINLKWFDYDGYPQYEQLWDKFDHNVSILDLLFNNGKQSNEFMRYVNGS